MITVWWDVLSYTLTGFSNMPVPVYQTARYHIAGDSKSENHPHNNLLSASQNCHGTETNSHIALSCKNPTFLII